MVSVMGRLRIDPTNTYFIKDGKPFFLLSDTIWMAFQKMNLDAWEELVRTRREQGFNALQMSVLPVVHDNALGKKDLFPFPMKNGMYDFSSPNNAYFDRAEQMLQIMRRYGMIPFLHLFWVDYIPDTRNAARYPEATLPEAYIAPLTRYFVGRFKKYEPIYSVSGDTLFETERVVSYYRKVFDVLQEEDPTGLTTMHLHPDGNPPEVLCAHPQYHFYAYQSAHNVSSEKGYGQSTMLRLSKLFREKTHKKPVVNTEPCYEGHGFGGRYGRFGSFDVRRAIWQSLLSGANAGISYGAHGIWQVYEAGDVFKNTAVSGMPYAWRTALNFEGAWDAGFAKWLYETYRMEKLVPSGAYNARSDELCFAVSDDGLAVMYLPYNDDVTLCMDLRDYRVQSIALQSKRMLTPELVRNQTETTVLRGSCNEDMLIIAQKNGR